MEEKENIPSLDLEYKRYLQIMRPYLGQLVDEEAIRLCNSWIKRLSSCSDEEKSMRNRYIFALCYQLAKGVLGEPFLKFPSKSELQEICEISESASSSEVEYLVVDGEDNNTQILFDNKKPNSSDTDFNSKDNDFDTEDSNKSSRNHLTYDGKSSQATRKQTILCYTCPEMMRACATELCSDLYSHSQGTDEYEYRANNLILRLREIKKQNMLLNNELLALKAESKGKTSCESLRKVNISTSTYTQAESSATVKTMKNKLQSIEEDKASLLRTLESLQEQLDEVQEIKRREIEDIEAKHKIEITKMKTGLRDENKNVYEEKIDQLKEFYEKHISQITEANSIEIHDILKSRNETISERDTIIHEKNREIYEKNREIKEMLKVIEEKVKEIQEKDKIIHTKDTEIENWKSKLEAEKTNFHSIINKFLNKSNEDSSCGNMKSKAQELEKRLIKMEKSKVKCMKAYESKLASLQREKHLAECSLQLQLVRQRTQVINEIADENQGELNTALDKLEAKYKDIVANVQSTAIERRMQDELTINAIVKAACACNLRSEGNHSQCSGKPGAVKHNKEGSCDSEISGVMHKKVNPNKSLGEESAHGGYCLNGEKFGELLEKVYIPQRDYEISIKK